MSFAAGLRTAAGVILRPSTTFAALRDRPAPCFGLACGAILGLLWAGFVGLLAAAGHAPSMDRGLPVAAEQYYATAAIYMTPLWIALTALTASAAHGVARTLGGTASWGASMGACGSAYALPFLVAYVVPDLALYGIVGHQGMGRFVPALGGITVVLITVRMVQAVRIVHGLSWGRAIAAALVAAVVQAPLVGALVR